MKLTFSIFIILGFYSTAGNFTVILVVIQKEPFLITSASLLSTSYLKVRRITQLMAEVLSLYIERYMWIVSRCTVELPRSLIRRNSYTVKFHDGDFCLAMLSYFITNRAIIGPNCMQSFKSLH